MAQFPNHPMFRGFNRPLRIECEVFELGYEGRIPEALNGAFYRCGPDPQFPPRDPNDLGINGDGYVSSFRFQNGHVDFCHVGRRYRYGFMAVKEPSEPQSALAPSSFNCVGRIDHHTGDVETFFVGEDAVVQEPVFVPEATLGRARVRQAPELQ